MTSGFVPVVAVGELVAESLCEGVVVRIRTLRQQGGLAAGLHLVPRKMCRVPELNVFVGHAKVEQEQKERSRLC